MELCTIIILALLTIITAVVGIYMGYLKDDMEALKSSRNAIMKQIREYYLLEIEIDNKLEFMDRTITHYISVISSLELRLDKLEGLDSEDPGENK